jgi:CheY-like chemotaxis protein
MGTINRFMTLQDPVLFRPLPIVPIKSVPNAQASDIETFLKMKRILIVEDDAFLQMQIKRVIQKLHPTVEITWAVSLKDAYVSLKKAMRDKSASFELVFCDIYLKNFGTGLDFWNYCRKKYPQIPFAFMSSMPIEEFIESVPPMTLTPPLLSKPFSIQEFEKVLGLLMQNTYESNITD